MSSKKHLKEVFSIVEEAGFVIDSTASASNHIKMKVRIDDRRLVITAPSSPSDWRSMKNFRATCRKLAKP